MVGSSADAAVGLVSGSEQWSLARVRSRAIASGDMYIVRVTAELGEPRAAHNLGYLVPCTFVGKSGYYWNDDKLATGADDDYATISFRCTIDKAYSIAYRTLVEEIGEEVLVEPTGSWRSTTAKGLRHPWRVSITREVNIRNDIDNASDLGV